MIPPVYLTLENLTGATIQTAERHGPWLVLKTTKGEFHVAGGRVRIGLECPRCKETNRPKAAPLVEVVQDAHGEQGYCSICGHAWPLQPKPVMGGSTGE